MNQVHLDLQTRYYNTRWPSPEAAEKERAWLADLLGTPVWITQELQVIPYTFLKDDHLLNILADFEKLLREAMFKGLKIQGIWGKYKAIHRECVWRYLTRYIPEDLQAYADKEYDELCGLADEFDNPWDQVE